MIIVITQNSTVFVNEKEYRNISHIKDQKMVVAYRAGENPELIAQIGGKPECIEDVESVQYYSDTEAVKYCDQGNELESLSVAYKELLHRYKNLKKERINLDSDIIIFTHKVADLQKQLDEVNAKVKRYESGTD